VKNSDPPTCAGTREDRNICSASLVTIEGKDLWVAKPPFVIAAFNYCNVKPERSSSAENATVGNVIKNATPNSEEKRWFCIYLSRIDELLDHTT
jgi:hypothetical protein